jgi:hypothetical protein
MARCVILCWPYTGVTDSVSARFKKIEKFFPPSILSGYRLAKCYGEHSK